MSESAIRAAVRTSRSLSEAARTLGVNRSTLHRWIEADPSLKAPIRDRQEAAQEATRNAELLTPDAWTHRIEELYELDDIERITLDLARQALEIANDKFAKPGERLSAMGRFTLLVKELNLEAPENGKTETPKAKLYAIR